MKRLSLIWKVLLGRQQSTEDVDAAYENGTADGRYDALTEVDKILSDASIPHPSYTRSWDANDWETLADEFANVATRVSELER